jgi:hypothetical protein
MLYLRRALELSKGVFEVIGSVRLYALQALRLQGNTYPVL